MKLEIMKGGRIRARAHFSIGDVEWPATRTRLEGMLQAIPGRG